MEESLLLLLVRSEDLAIKCCFQFIVIDSRGFDLELVFSKLMTPATEPPYGNSGTFW